MIRPLGALGLALILLAGCETTEQQGEARPESPWTPERVAGLLEPPRPKVVAPAVREIPPPVPRRRPRQIAALAETPPEPPIESLVGLDFDGTEKLLGKPALDEVQAPARVWAYNGRGCVLSIFFYPNVEGSGYRALTYEVKGTEDEPELSRRCFSELIQENGGV